MSENITEGRRYTPRTIITMILYGAVFVSNMICIVSFVVSPQDFVRSYQVAGSAGAEAAIRGVGIAFAMWNTTYPFFIINPRRNRTLGIVIIVQQIVGLFGELCIISGLDETTQILSNSLMRFVYFDAGGLVLLLVGYFILRRDNSNI